VVDQLGAVVLVVLAAHTIEAHATLTWAADHAAELGVAAARLVVVGIGACAALTERAAVLAVDEGWPPCTGSSWCGRTTSRPLPSGSSHAPWLRRCGGVMTLASTLADRPSVDADRDTIIDAAIAGDDGAFTVLVDWHRHELFRHCIRIFHSSEQAKDAGQEALLRAWRSRSHVAGRATPVPDRRGDEGRLGGLLPVEHLALGGTEAPVADDDHRTDVDLDRLPDTGRAE
jgi:hypothetical protein